VHLLQAAAAAAYVGERLEARRLFEKAKRHSLAAGFSGEVKAAAKQLTYRPGVGKHVAVTLEGDSA
jgi:hypothetical protein